MPKYKAGENPFIYFIVPLTGGVCTGYLLRDYPSLLHFSFAGCMAIAAVFIILHRKRAWLGYTRTWITGLLTFAFLFLTGIHLFIRATEINSVHHFSRIKGDFLFVEVKQAEVKTKNVRSVVRVHSRGTVLHRIPATGHLLVYFKGGDAQEVRQGDHLVLPALYNELSKPLNPGQFDYKAFMERRQVWHQAFLKTGEWYSTGHTTPGLNGKIAEISAKMQRMLREQLKVPEVYGVASALLLGSRKDLDRESLETYANTGTLHILSVSGLHVGILFLALSILFTPFERYKRGKYVKMTLILCVIWFYAFLTGLAPPIIRASVMISFFIAGAAFDKPLNTLNSLAASAFLILLFDPYALFDVGFQLSYLAVAGIITLHPLIYRLIPMENYLADKAWSLAAVSIAAQLTSLPLLLYYFHSFPVYFLISNLLAVPLSALILYSGIILIGCSPFFFIAEPVSYITSFLIRSLDFFLAFINQWPGAVIKGIQINGWQTSLLFILLVCSVVFLVHKRKSLIFYILGILILIFGIHAYKAITEPPKRLIVYHSKNPIIACLDKERAIFFSVDTIAPDEFSFILKSSFDLYGISTYEPGNGKSSFLQLYGKRIFMPGIHFEWKPRSGKLQVDYVICSYLSVYKLNYLSDHFNFSKLILTGNLSGDASLIEKSCKDKGIALYHTASKGAFITEL